MSDELTFKEEVDSEVAPKGYYKVLIVDDEPDIHAVTKIALFGFTFDGNGLQILNAYSAKEAEQVLLEHPDTAIILLDVVMETEDAGLLLVDVIRNRLNLKNTRIVLRTGQPGQAPEQKVIVQYDINDYKSKSELTSQKLFTLLHTCLRSYRDIVALEDSKAGLKQVIQASKGIFDKHAFDTFISGALHQLKDLLHLDDAFVMTHELGVYKFTDLDSSNYETYDQFGVKKDVEVASLPDSIVTIFNQAIDEQAHIYTDKHIVLYCRTQFFITLFLVTPNGEMSVIDKELINLFAENISIGLENVHLEESIRSNQKEIIYRLGEIVENRSKESGFHVKRVALYCELLAQLAGLSTEEVKTLKLASPLHDVGKISIPDAILHKPGKLNEEEWEIMKTHASIGAELLEDSNLFLLKTASIVAGSHHEKWDGTGYPKGLAGEDIHIYGRITALADVFDALANKRCYKPAWSMEKLLAHIEEQSGKHFDPTLVDLLMNNIEKFEVIKTAYEDQ
ncbi:HD domain-containing phosphohydrolase [Colwelliaceae bacterium 6471]